MRRFTHKHMVAAEIYGYSYAHYAEHLDSGNIRFSKLMPHDVSILERADREGWGPARLAAALEIPEKRVAQYQRLYHESREIANAPTPAEAFRRGVRYSIQHAVERGLDDKAAIERLVTQICYRAADLGFLLALEEKHLSDYSVELREETEYDQEYWSKVLDQSFQEEFGQDEGAA